ncbi:MAG: signal peptide peptidase SppA [Proteobacteria bacterium]|nr:MAG: signal peptide peptidase SppA [Pseudomonadota bacterium]
MKKNPLVLLLAISGVFFSIFLLFVFFTMGNIVKDRSLLARGGVSIGVVKVRDVIMDSQRTLKELKEFEEDSSIKAIMVRIDSPGGAVGPSQEIHDAILRVKKTKPVVASFESVAASGGFYIAVACDRIVSNAGTLTGSIGVIMNMANLSELYKWAKVERYNIKSGKFKDVGSENRPMTPEERDLMQNLVNNVYEQFLKAVADGRKLPVEKVRPYADGRVLSGQQAQEVGLVDKLGGVDVALDTIKELAKLDKKQKVNLVYPEPKRRSLLDMLGKNGADSLADAVMSRLGLENVGGNAALKPSAQVGLYFL